MRTATDALRSVKRYTALALGDAWEVRLSSEKGVFNRPFATVIQVPTLEYIVESPIRVKVQTVYQIGALPMPAATADLSQFTALDVAEQLFTAFGGPGVGMGFPYRIPLYDYASTPTTGPDAFADEDDRDPRDYLKMEAPASLQVTQNPDDETLWSITANIRMSWLRSAAVPSTAAITANVTAEANEHDGD